MIHSIKIAVAAIMAVLPILAQAQPGVSEPGSFAYLKQTFPKLSELYDYELSNCHTHYIFAVDVSGSMVKYNGIVTPAIEAFVRALPVGEQVSVIPFGTDAKENTPGLCTRIQGDSQKQVLGSSLSTLYVNDGYSKEFKRNTDVKKAVQAVNKAILNNQEAQMNVVVIITDFLNDLPGVGERKLQKSDLEKLNHDFDNVTDNTYTRVVAMQLPKAGSGAGFCLDQLQESVFCNTSNTRRFDVIHAINDQAAISHWFDQLSRDIMTEKLKAVIQLDNERNLSPSLQTRMNIDGYTVADIHWTPNKLYRKIQIGATTTDSCSDYTFENNEKVWKISQDTDIKDLKLGRLVHKNYGLRRFSENLNLGLTLPTDYDDELKKLSIDKPLQATSDNKFGWIFTFFLPFWLTVTLAILLILYILAVIKAAVRNSRERFIGTVDFTDNRGRDIGSTVFVKANPGQTLLIGQGGNRGCDLPSAKWTVQVLKKSPSPFLFWKRPAFEWSAKAGGGFVCDGKNKKRGLLGRYGKRGTRSVVNLNCGTGSDNITNGVKIVIKKNK